MGINTLSTTSFRIYNFVVSSEILLRQNLGGSSRKFLDSLGAAYPTLKEQWQHNDEERRSGNIFKTISNPSPTSSYLVRGFYVKISVVRRRYESRVYHWENRSDGGNSQQLGADWEIRGKSSQTLQRKLCTLSCTFCMWKVKYCLPSYYLSDLFKSIIGKLRGLSFHEPDWDPDWTRPREAIMGESKYEIS